MVGIAAALAWGAGVAAAAVAAAAVELKPQHIMSLNLCSDDLLLDLVPAQRIASVTYLSRSRSNAYRWLEAANVPVNHASAEEVLAQEPDLVIGSTFTTPSTRALLQRVKIPLLEVPAANSFEDIRAITREVAQAVGEAKAGEALIERMDATLHDLSATAPRARLRVAVWDGGGSVPASGTLFDAILSAAGAVNVAASMQAGRRGSFDIEQVLMARPDVLAFGADGNGTPALRRDADQHPLLLKLYDRRRITYPEVLFGCGAPESAAAAAALRTSLMAAMQDGAP